jgi:chromosome segregation ATPase
LRSCVIANVPSQGEDPLALAYRQRTLQLHEARAALGEAVHTMRLELAARREETEALRGDNESLRGNNDTLQREWKELGAEVEWQREERARLIAETERLREGVARLERELGQARELIATLQNMKAVRWSAGPRRLRRRLRRQSR